MNPQYHPPGSCDACAEPLDLAALKEATKREATKDGANMSVMGNSSAGAIGGGGGGSYNIGHSYRIPDRTEIKKRYVIGIAEIITALNIPAPRNAVFTAISNSDGGSVDILVEYSE